MEYNNLPPIQTDPGRQMFSYALGLAPGLGRMRGLRVLVVGDGQRRITDAEPPISVKTRNSRFSTDRATQRSSSAMKSRLRAALPC